MFCTSKYIFFSHPPYAYFYRAVAAAARYIESYATHFATQLHDSIFYATSSWLGRSIPSQRNQISFSLHLASAEVCTSRCVSMFVRAPSLYFCVVCGMEKCLLLYLHTYLLTYLLTYLVLLPHCRGCSALPLWTHAKVWIIYLQISVCLPGCLTACYIHTTTVAIEDFELFIYATLRKRMPVSLRKV